MDPESWRMAATNLKFLNQQKNVTVPRTLQVNHSKYLSTERLKKTAIVMAKEEPARLEGRLLHVEGRTSYRCGRISLDQGEVNKGYGEDSRKIMVSKHSVNKWVNLVPNSLDHRGNVALITYGSSVQKFKAPYEMELKKLPTLNKEITRSFITKQEKTYSQVFRKDVKISASNCSNAKDPACKVFGDKVTVKTEPILVEDDDVHDEDSSLYPGIPFHPSHKRVARLNHAPFQGGTSEPLKRMKLSGQEALMRSAERFNQKMLNQQRIQYKELPAASGTFMQNDIGVSSIQRDKYVRIPPDDSKGELAISVPKEKSGSSTFRRFLLIDSQGLPYTVVVEESKTSKDNIPTNDSSSDLTHIDVSKSVAPRKVYKCPVCFRIFEYLSYLQRHSIAHSQQKPHVCKICGKAFKRTSHLTRHKYTHFGGKPCQCQICHRRFRDIGELSRHQLSHTGERPHQCEVCHMRFGERNTLQRHMLAKH
ncbi:PREDICTED: zinc finger protein 527-like [Nanorana parkeri]|uniref:zinc finger protein 527-like n=1 Tax=Nanorana parkeri TaxID=125878 RepID=UPI0008546391|nr:PREDICTED: zinc finger protein 527-like [Nanorana parkeri]